MVSIVKYNNNNNNIMIIIIIIFIMKIIIMIIKIIKYNTVRKVIKPNQSFVETEVNSLAYP